MEERIAVQSIFKEKTQIRRGLYSNFQRSEGQGMQFSRGASRFPPPAALTRNLFRNFLVVSLSSSSEALGSRQDSRESVMMILNATRVTVDGGICFFLAAKKWH